MNCHEHICHMCEADARYYPPVIGNGDLSVSIDFEGIQNQIRREWMTPGIFRAGKRYFQKGFPLIHFGYVTQQIAGAEKLSDWIQTLNTEEAFIRCQRSYPDGFQAETMVFCHAEKPRLGFRVRFSEEREFTFRYTIPYQRKLNLAAISDKMLAYDADSMAEDRGTVALLPPEGAKSVTNPDGLSFTVTGKSFDFFLVFDEPAVQKLDFDEEFLVHTKNWRDFWEEGFVRGLPEKIQKMYNTALYHLKIFSTKWSIPTGIFPLHWEGRYFAYDELYTFEALLSGGHLKMAKKIPDFRYSTLAEALRLNKATCEKAGTAASFSNEALEDGSEGTPPGFWDKHIIQTANVGICAGMYAEYSGDKEFLKEKAYPLMRGCSEFFRRGHIYRVEGGKTIIGKCTDEERLGAFRDNCFQITCAVIRLFRMTVRYALELQVDAPLAKELEQLAGELFAALPSDGKKYLPCFGYDERTIAVYCGTYPYRVLAKDNPLQAAAIADADSHFEDFALQYFSSDNSAGMSNWYRGIIMMSYILNHRHSDALKLLNDAPAALGCFDECFEVFAWKYRPWFSTAAGAILRTVHGMLLSDTEISEEVLCFWPDVEFKLQLPSGKKLYAKAENGKIITRSVEE